MLRGTGVLDLRSRVVFPSKFVRSRVVFPFMVGSRVGTSSMSSLVRVMSPSYRNHFLDVLQLLSLRPSQYAVLSLQFLIRHMHDWNRVGDDDSSTDRICIQVVTGATISRLVASAFNDISALERVPFEHWVTSLYDAVALELQRGIVMDNEQDNLPNSTLTVSVCSTSTAAASTSAFASTTALSLENESPGDDSS